MSTPEKTPSPEENARAVGVTANVGFLIFLLLPFVSLNGVTMHSNYRYIIWIVAIIALVLRIMEKEKAAVFFSVLSTIAWIVIYAMQWQAGRVMEFELGLAMKTHLFTALLLLLASILMIHPSLVNGQSK